jgi:hypothetical protein
MLCGLSFANDDVLFHFFSPLGYCLQICPRGQNVDKNEKQNKKAPNCNVWVPTSTSLLYPFTFIEVFILKNGVDKYP